MLRCVHAIHAFEDGFFFFLNSIIQTQSISIMREKFLQDPKNIVNISVLILYIERLFFNVMNKRFIQKLFGRYIIVLYK